jgi:hypothetical protein
MDGNLAMNYEFENMSEKDMREQPPIPTMQDLFYYIIGNGGKIVSSNDLSPFEITQARASSRMFVDENGFGFIWLPSFYGRMPETEDEVQIFEICYPLPIELPDELKTFQKPSL